MEQPAPEAVKEAEVMETVDEVAKTTEEGDLIGQIVMVVGGDYEGKIGVCVKKCEHGLMLKSMESNLVLDLRI